MIALTARAAMVDVGWMDTRQRHHQWDGQRRGGKEYRLI
jgi:hypothetical protein